MASPANRHCANCIGALSFPIEITDGARYRSFLVDGAGLDTDLCSVFLAAASRANADHQMFNEVLSFFFSYW